jgi:hypothetical protein
MLHEYNVDSYLGLQLLCCLDFSEEPPVADPDKYAFFLTLLSEDVIKLAASKIERLRYEIEHYEMKELLEEYCILLPSEHRTEAYNNCRKILELKKPLAPAGAQILGYLRKQFMDD